MKRLFPCLTMACMMIGCASMEAGSPTENAAYEISLLRKNVTHLQRENEVIKNENLEYRRDARIKQAEIDRYKAEVEGLKKHHAGELAEAEQRYRTAQEQAATLERILREKIKTVEEQRAQAEARMREELKTAAEQGRRRDEEHRQSEEKLKREYADREFQYSKEANECAKRLSACEQNAAECRARIEERALRSDERPGTSGSPRDRTPPAAGVKK
ncbi:MAG TPA: hypothetical protein PLE73_05585 [Spirochaetota bacterium]|nr:hypothetical protein [Spirochaetota bacterium]HOS40647.1 hypothetical protein [Spirochaetota bacterium]HPI22647.1 hypothetical protein [Spirochaetota bacterium]HPU87217.1 hypothetical protein [Spirochaetota bacterium]